MNGESAIGAQWPGIKGALRSGFALVVGDGMKRPRWVVPGNRSICANANECRGVIGGERANGNVQGRWSSYRQRLEYQQANQQEAKNPSFQGHSP